MVLLVQMHEMKSHYASMCLNTVREACAGRLLGDMVWALQTCGSPHGFCRKGKGMLFRMYSIIPSSHDIIIPSLILCLCLSIACRSGGNIKGRALSMAVLKLHRHKCHTLKKVSPLTIVVLRP